MTKILITVEYGIVTGIIANSKDIAVFISDNDNPSFDQAEINVVTPMFLDALIKHEKKDIVNRGHQ